MSNGRTALITGAARGIGREIALRLAKSGFNIAVNCRKSSPKVDELLEELRNFGVKAEAISADVSSIDDAKNLVDKCFELFGSIDVLVNNAGITRDNLLIRMSEKDFDDVISTNLKGAFNCIKHAVPYMLKKRWGRIINISSVVGITGNAGQVNYSAAKAGIIGITKSLAKEIGTRGITVNAVAPGFIETDMTEVLPEKIKEQMLGLIPLKRIGKPADVANLVSFLSSDEASYITGQVINVDGGMVM